MDFQLSYTPDMENERWNVKLSGEIDIFNSAQLKTQLTELLAERNAHLYVDCKALEFIDSTALGALVGVLKTVKENGREMHLLNVRPNLFKLFRLTNLDDVFIFEEESADAK
ncbi:MAG: STAS domain-containing protein [Clostridiales bacterium]|jgi:anti-sigma B factor antagonist|nr:STAS domain-containing protein [Clostridiales bacterium]